MTIGRLTILALVLALVGTVPALANYTPPVGIPNPSWGRIHPIDTPIPARPAPWITEQAGYYYVDPQKGTDTGRLYGTPNAPRATVPSTIPAGSRVELTGTHSYSRIFSAEGTEGNPIFIVGTSGAAPSIKIGWYFGRASYVFLDNLEFSVAKPYFTLKNGYVPDHIVLRNSKVTGNGVKGNTGSVGVVGSSNKWAEHIVFYNNEISYLGKFDYIGEDDMHAFKPGSYSRNIWLLNSHHHHNGGDSVQVSDALSGPTATTPYNVYIGNNIFHNDGENAVDIKSATDVIISSNTMYGYVPTGSSSGEAVVTHNNSKNIWIVNNEIYDSKWGIISTGAFDIYIIGNVIHNIKETTNESHQDISSYRSGSAITAYNTGNIHVYHNTIHDSAIGISYEALSGYKCNIVGNIVSELKTGETSGNSSYNIILKGADDTVAASYIEHNIFYSPLRVHLDGKTFTDMPGLKSAGKCNDKGGCLTLNPMLINPPLNYGLQSGAPGIDAGAATIQLSTVFTEAYGLDIKKDPAGTTRPAGGSWDIGAYEYNSSNIDVQNNTTKPIILKIQSK